MLKCKFTDFTWPSTEKGTEPYTTVLLSLCRCRSITVWGLSQSTAVSGPVEGVPTVTPWILDSNGCHLSPRQLFIYCCWPHWCCLLIQRVSIYIIWTSFTARILAFDFVILLCCYWRSFKINHCLMVTLASLGKLVHISIWKLSTGSARTQLHRLHCITFIVSKSSHGTATCTSWFILTFKGEVVIK